MTRSLLTTMFLADSVEKFDPDQERDESGKWSAGGGGASTGSGRDSTAHQDALSQKNLDSALNHSRQAVASKTPKEHTKAANEHHSIALAWRKAAEALPKEAVGPKHSYRSAADNHSVLAALHEQAASGERISAKSFRSAMRRVKD